MLINIHMKYSIDVYDNLVHTNLQSELWDYIQNQKWHMIWLHKERCLTHYTPADGLDWFMGNRVVGSNMHRSLLASDEASLKALHFPVYLLWKDINKKLGNKYKLTGLPETMYDKETEVPPTENTTIDQGWRAYVNAIHNPQVWGTGLGYVHRDNPDLNNDRYVTMLYVVNEKWYPSWGAEIKYYAEDPEGITGDHQQFNIVGQQKRGFNIGWLDEGQVVSPKPGRLIVHDSRCLHATGPSSCRDVAYPSIKIAFRAERV